MQKKGQVETGLNTEFIVGLYDKYADDLKRVRRYMKNLYLYHNYRYWSKRVVTYVMKRLGVKLKSIIHFEPQLDDIESEITYLLIRETKPGIIVEISPYLGGSTIWILMALKDNGRGKLYSYDLICNSTKIVPMDLSKNRWIFIMGDIKNNIDRLPHTIDFLFMDSDHSERFARWYIQNIFPKLKTGTLISIHDVFHTADSRSYDGEGRIVIDWLEHKGIKYFTASYTKRRGIYDKIMLVKKRIKLDYPINLYQDNSMIFFLKSNRDV